MLKKGLENIERINRQLSRVDRQKACQLRQRESAES